MRKIGSEKEIERKKKRNVLVISFFMLIVLVFGTIGFGFLSGTGESSNENSNVGGNLQNVGDKWAVVIDGKAFYFKSSPESVENISVNVFANLGNFAGRPLYIVSDNEAISQEIGLTLGSYSPRVQAACYGTCDEDLPEKDCSENLIIWQDSTENKVYQEEGCIFIEGDMRAVDAFLYELFGLL